MYDIYAKIRDEKGIRDADVAFLADIRQGVLSDWKSGKSIPSTKNLLKIARAMDVSLDYLTTGKSSDDYFDMHEKQLIGLYRKLNSEAQEKLFEYADMLSRMPECQKGQKSLGSNVG